MPITLQRILLVLAGIAFAVALFVVPDMVMNLRETLSVGLKAVWATALLSISIAAARTKEPAIATFTVTACAVLTLLLVFGGVVRMSELGIW